MQIGIGFTLFYIQTIDHLKTDYLSTTLNKNSKGDEFYVEAESKSCHNGEIVSRDYINDSNGSNHCFLVCFSVYI